MFIGTGHEPYSQENQAPKRDITGLQSATVLTLGHHDRPMMPGPKYGYFNAHICCTSNNSNSVLPDAEQWPSARAPWRAPPIGTSTVYELLHRNGS